MRALEAKSGNTYFHNGDFSGNVKWEELRNGAYVTLQIPFEDMKELVAQYIRTKKIAELEEASLDKLLEG